MIGLPREDGVVAQVREMLAPASQRRVLPAGTVLFREGELEGALVAIHHGQVKVSRTLPSGQPVTLYLFGPGDVFGFMPLLDGMPYPATAHALTAVDATLTTRAALRHAIAANPELAMGLVTLLARCLRRAFERIDTASNPDAVARVGAALLELVPAAGSASALVVELPAPSAEMAGVLGMVPQSFSRALTRLVSSGIVHRLGAGRLQVLDLERLRAAAAGEHGEEGPRRAAAGR